MTSLQLYFDFLPVEKLVETKAIAGQKLEAEHDCPEEANTSALSSPATLLLLDLALGPVLEPSNTMWRNMQEYCKCQGSFTQNPS